MPIPAGPMKTTCEACGWSKVTQQNSDVLFIPSQCECCGSEQLKHAPAGTLDRFNPLSVILDMLKK
jgi:predicted Zn-ribbon and HTH transcriptional regulator